MATEPTTTTGGDPVFHFRLQTLIIDEGTEVLWNIFDDRLQMRLDDFLDRERTIINRLLARKIITQSQYDLLYPGIGLHPTIKDLDISLVICLLKNLPSLGLNRNYRWYVQPQSTDTSIEADLCRLKLFQKEIVHRSPTAQFNQSSFEAKWTEVEQVLLRLNSTSSNPLADLHQKLYLYKSHPIEQWHRMERGLELKPAAQKLQNDLISFYKLQQKTVPLSPLFDEGLPLLEFYVMPDILSVNVTRSRDGNKSQRTPVRKLRDVFYKEDRLCNNIYLAADAGLGKTAFCKRLALTWCHAKQPNEREEECFTQNEIEGIRGFSFVFLVLLGDSSSECDIDSMILNQICLKLPHVYNLENLGEVLREETCLVLLDGLDGWSHPLNSCRKGPSFIPHQRVRENIAVLTTTRPWKLCLSGPRSSQIDQKLELKGLSGDSAKKLKRAVISHLHKNHDGDELDSYEAEFNIFVQNKLKSNLTSIPLFLMYFLFVWYYKYIVGKTLADYYSSITELLLSRTVHIDRIQIPKAESVQDNIPLCFDSNTLCKQFYSLLTSLGKLAVHTLLVETKDHSTLFDGCMAEGFLSKDDLTLCFNTGIITQSKAQGASLLHQSTNVSFIDKTLQEFLAALHMSSELEHKSVSEKIKCVKDILNMSNILMFCFGINAKSAILCELLNIINEDAITQEYRSSIQEVGFPNQLKDLQDMFVSCCKEIPLESEASLCLQDVFIDSSCHEEGYHENLKQLTTRNKQNIRSLYIDMPDMEDTLFDTPGKVFGLSDLKNIEKIYYKGENDIDGISPLLNNTIKCLSLLCDWPTTGSCSLVVDKVTRFQTLAVIQISWSKMNHSELSLLLDYISNRASMREIVLEGLSCTDHCSSCTELSVNLTRHSSLKKLTLYQLPLTRVIIDMTSLEKCCLQYLYNEDLVLELLNCTDSNLHTFHCGGLKSSVAVDVVLNTLLSLRHISEVKLTWIKLGERVLGFMNIELLQLVRVTMEESTFSKLVESVPKFDQQVEVHVHYCTILQREAFERVKENMKASQHFTILVDDEDWFEFATKKGGD